MAKYLYITIMLIICVYPIHSQIITNSPYLNFSGGNAAYSVYDKEIYLSDEDRSSSPLIKFLHELGHHIWFYGDVDTTAYTEYYKYSENVWEDFANDHYYYFVGWLNEGEINYQIFYEFYNRGNK